MYMIGELSFFLGLQITQRPEGMFISQEKYLREILKRFQMEDSKPMSTPMVTGCKLSKDDYSPDVDKSSYRSMIGSLLYITTSHPYIMHAVGMVERYQAAPKQSHLQDVKRIFVYLKETMIYGLWYPRNQNLQLTVYSDADWSNCVDKRKSTSGGAFFLGDSLVAWLSKKTRFHFFINHRGRVHCCCYLLHSGIMDDLDTFKLRGKIHCTDPNSL